MSKHILIPIDFSATSEAAARYGFALAADLGARITLLHALSPAIVALPEAAYAPSQEERRELSDTARAKLRALAFRLARAGVHAGCEVVEGPAVDVILGVAASDHVDLIVMGTHGRRGLAHLMMGSVAENVLRNSSCPVITIGRGCSPGQADVEARATGR